MFDAFSQNTHKAEVYHHSELQQLLIHASLQITAKSTLPTCRPEQAWYKESSMIWNGYHNFISNNMAFSVPRLALSLPAIRQGCLLSPYPIYSPSPWLQVKTGVNVLLQPDGPELCSVSALKPPLLTSLIAFTWFPLAFQLQCLLFAFCSFRVNLRRLYKAQTPVWEAGSVS